MTIFAALEFAVKLHILSAGCGIAVLIETDFLDWLRRDGELIATKVQQSPTTKGRQ